MYTCMNGCVCNILMYSVKFDILQFACTKMNKEEHLTGIRVPILYVNTSDIVQLTVIKNRTLLY